MKPLVLTLKQEPNQRLDLSPLLPELLAAKTAKEIAAIELQVAGALASRFGQITASQAGSVQAPSLGISDLVAAAR